MRPGVPSWLPAISKNTLETQEESLTPLGHLCQEQLVCTRELHPTDWHTAQERGALSGICPLCSPLQAGEP